MHDHILNFKADFDILGTNNTVAVVNQVPVSTTYPWSNGKARNTMKLEKIYIDSEDHSRLFWGANAATQYSVINKDAINKYGEYRGYRISPSLGAIHLTVEDSSNLVNSARWATHDLQVTKQHDTEPRAAHAYNNQDVVESGNASYPPHWRFTQYCVFDSSCGSVVFTVELFDWRS
jgi:primary-amine oxidase